MNCKIASKVKYGAGLYCGQTQAIRDKFTTILMLCNELIYNKCTYNMSYERICKKIEEPHPELLICQDAVKQLHRTITRKRPKQIYSLIRFSRSPRDCHKLVTSLSFTTKRA